MQRAKNTVVAYGFKPILGRDSSGQLGIRITQKPCPNIEINNTNHEDFWDWNIESESHKNHRVKSKFIETIELNIKEDKNYQFAYNQKSKSSSRKS